MIFNSLTFVVFFSTLLIMVRLPLNWTTKKSILLVASCLFYASYHPAYLLLIVYSTVLDWVLALLMDRAARPFLRRMLLIISLAGNLGFLAFFKYADFLIQNVDVLLEAMGASWQPRRLDILLPVGISFYTFQTLSYTIDVYRREIPADRTFLDFALFVTFFPQLVAGPIVRACDFLPQLKEPRSATQEQFWWGLTLLVLGLTQKMVLSDAVLAPVADKVFAVSGQAGLVDAWVGTLAFAGQIFFDFAGYSLCAIGVALCFGFVLTPNFRCPYAARGFSDFWRRWHISLSQWLRDYLYIPLGGSRKGTPRTYVNLSATMLLGGLWHGASWNFVIWGLLHGIYLVVEHGIVWLSGGTRWARMLVIQIGVQLVTFCLVCIAWVFFRAPTLAESLQMIKTMMGSNDQLMLPLLKPVEIGAVLGLVALMLLGHHLLRNKSLEHVFTRMPWWARSGVLALLLISILHIQGNARGFIYFQF